MLSRFPGISVLCQHLNLFQRVSRLEIHYFYRTGNVGYNIYLATVNCQIISRISQSPVIPGGHTSTYLFINDQQGDMQLAVSDMDIYQNLTPRVLAGRKQLLEGSQVVVIDTNLPAESIAWLADNCHVPIFADPVSTVKAEKLRPVLGKLHTLKPNRLEAELLSGVPITGTDSLHRAAQTLLEEGEHLSPDTQRRLLGNVAEDSRWLIRMVENLLSITRIGGEGGRLQKTEELAEEVAAGAAEQVSKRHPECRIAVQGGEEPLFAPMEPTLIEQVLINLMENAIQHGGAGGLVEVRFRQLGASLEFQVRDHGPGLAPEDIPGLFQGGAQTSSDATRGMGIGLSLCQTIIAAHGGVISGENHPGGGALFTFSIPLDGEAAGGENAWNQTTS